MKYITSILFVVLLICTFLHPRNALSGSITCPGPTELEHPCSLNVSGGNSGSPVIIMTRCWDPEDPDCMCNAEGQSCSSDTSFIFAMSCMTENYTYATSELYDERCNGEALLGNNGALRDSNIGEVGKIEAFGKEYGVQMVFFKPQFVNPYPHFGIVKENNEEVSEDNMAGHVEPDAKEVKESEDQELIDMLDKDLNDWSEGRFYIPSPVSINVDNKIIYMMGYPITLISDEIGYKWRDGYGDDWIDKLARVYKGTDGRPTAEGFYDWKSYYNHSSRGMSMLIGRNWNCPEGDVLCGRGFARYKKKIDLDSTLTIEGDGIVVFKNVHFILREGGSFKVKGKAKLIFSESKIEFETEHNINLEDGEQASFMRDNKEPLFQLENIEPNIVPNDILLDNLPFFDVPPIYLIQTKIGWNVDGNFISYVDTHLPIKTDWNNPTIRTILTDRGLDHILDKRAEFGMPGGLRRLNEPLNPWNLGYTKSVAFELDDSSFGGEISCKFESVDPSGQHNCKINKSDLPSGDIEFYFLHSSNGFYLAPFEPTDTGDGLRMRSSKSVIAFVPGQNKPMRIKAGNAVVHDESKPWECSAFKVDKDGNPPVDAYGNWILEYEVACNSGKMKRNDSNGDGYSDGCICKDDGYEIDPEVGDCVPSVASLSDDEILNRVEDDDGNIIDVVVQNCDGAHSVPNEDRSGCVECPPDQRESETTLGVCESFVDECGPDEIVSNHTCEACGSENNVPDPNDRTQCISCEGNEREENGVCVEFTCEGDYVPHNNDCVQCSGNKIAVNGECEACGSDEKKEENKCVPKGVEDIVDDLTDDSTVEETELEDWVLEAGKTENSYVDDIDNHSDVKIDDMAFDAKAKGKKSSMFNCSLIPGAKKDSSVWVLFLLFLSTALLIRKRHANRKSG